VVQGPQARAEGNGNNTDLPSSGPDGSGLRKMRFVGQARVAVHATLAATAYNLLRMAKLEAGAHGAAATRSRPRSVRRTQPAAEPRRGKSFDPLQASQKQNIGVLQQAAN
jgi:hypothetical protein